ncbi:hypothetical protein TRFO_04255 [Tritrichomonas foetus]|uniref:Adenylate and Guanylate cyclase catalytic domain containing protein n=1 Tax=Tritrichomonas foetus TaxID=1144522 RepID=A0A1J4KGR9_9EUKA|nr:hypothetical protein TRFO_04255 [Tritrichomonas foetus]|eukprot:OHT10250.1 hypothetical protein TRFO_04255 [Tritrichomonas foetus]
MSNFIHHIEIYIIFIRNNEKFRNNLNDFRRWVLNVIDSKKIKYRSNYHREFAMSVIEPSRNKPTSSFVSSRQTASDSFDDEQISIQRRENLIYPLFSEMSQVVKIPFWVYYVSQVISLFQFLSTGLWQNRDFFWGVYPDGNNYCHIAKLFVNCGLHIFEYNGLFISYIILIVVFFVIVLWHIFVIVYYNYFHQFYKFMLYITQIIQMVILPPLVPCYATHAGVALFHLGSEALSEEGISTSYVFYSIFFLISFGILFALFYFAFSFICDSPVLFQALEASWDPTPIICILAANCWSCFLGPIMDLFEKWFVNIFIVLSILLLIYAIYLLKDFPFLLFWVNPLIAGVVAGHIFLELCLIPLSFSDGIPQFIYVPMTVLFIIIAIVLSFFLLKKRKSKIINLLSYSSMGDKKICDANKKEHFDAFNLKTENDIKAFLRIGIANNCDMFLDFSFPHFITENYTSKTIFLEIAHKLSFFPSEIQYFAYCLGLIAKFGKLKFNEHFLYFQLKKVHMMRQSSLSKEASSTVRKIKKQSTDTISAIRSFWKELNSDHVTLDFSTIVSVRTTTTRLIGTFQDLTEKFSSNQEMCNIYSNFLLEGAGEFQEAMKWKSKAYDLELGKRSDNDFAFRSLVNTYPHYLLNRILDLHGKFLEKHSIAKETLSASSVPTTTGTSNEGLREQKIAEMTTQSITEANLRISLYKALRNTTLPGLAESKCFFAFQAVLMVTIFIIILAITPMIKNKFTVMIFELEQMNSVYSCMQCTSFIATYLIAVHPEVNTFGGYPIAYQLTHFPENEVQKKNWNVFNNTYSHLKDFVTSGFKSYSKVLISLMGHPIEKEQILETLLYEHTSIYSTEISEIKYDTKINMTNRASIYDSFMAFFKTLQYWSVGDENNTETVSSLMKGAYNMINLLPIIENIQDQISLDGNEYLQSQYNIFFYIEIILPIVLGILLLTLQIKSIVTLYSKSKLALQMLKKVNEETIQASLEPISLQSKDSKITTGSSQIRSKTSFNYLILPGFAVIAVCINMIMIFLIFFLGGEEINEIGNLLRFYTINAFRLGSILKLLSAVNMLSYHDTNFTHEILTDSFQSLDYYHSLLLQGDEVLPRLIGYDTEIDNNHFIDTCEETPNHYYQYYMCLSTDRAINQVQVLAQDLINTAKDMSTYTLNIDKYCNLLILVDFKLTQQMFDFHDKIAQYSKAQFSDVTDIMTIIAIVGIVISLVLMACSYVLIHTFEMELDGVRQLIRLLPPSMVLKNTYLTEFILGQSTSKYEYVFSPAQSIVLASSNAAISVSLDYTVNSINPSFTEITGLAPDEVLGQSLSELFPFPNGSSSSSSDENFSQQMLYDVFTKYKVGEISEKSYSLNMKCTNDQGKPLQVKNTIVPIYENESDKLASYVLVMRDMATEKTQEILAKNEKKRSEKILEKLIPKPVYEMFSRNDPDASTLFVSNSATIIYMQIVGLQDCVNSLSPSQLTNALSKIYETFDEVASKYPAVHAVNGCDDTLIACCGVFDFVDQPKDQAAQAVLFALEFNSFKDELNEQLVVDISYRIGINHGGPLCGNLLSMDTPTFDIIGPMVRTASKLASDGDVSGVLITESVLILLDQNDFHVEKARFVEGKGYVPGEQSYIITYLAETS